MNKLARLLLVVNGNSRIGYGHISRAKTLIDEFIENSVEIIILLDEKSPYQDDLIRSGFNVEIANFYHIHSLRKSVKDILINYRINIVLIDLIEEEYRNFSFLEDLRSNVYLVSITLFNFDFNMRYEHISFFPDYSNDKCYSVENERGKIIKLYEGKSYIVFRKEFKFKKNKIKKDAKLILVTMGGSDPKCLTLQVLDSIAELDVLIKVIFPKLASNYDKVINRYGDYSNVEFINQTNKIASYMAESDLIILNGGLTRYEACITQTPFLAISIHDIQYAITEKLTSLGAGVNLGVYSDLSSNDICQEVYSLLESYEKRKEMSRIMSNIFNSNCVNRIVNTILEQYNTMNL